MHLVEEIRAVQQTVIFGTICGRSEGSVGANLPLPDMGLMSATAQMPPAFQSMTCRQAS